MRPPSDAGKRSGSRYVLGDLLGRGGMAEVFAGHAVGDHGFQKPVAIKRLLPELANDEVFVERLIEEAKLLVGMQHGNIVSVLDLAREGDDVFLVMEFVDGPSLRQLIKARGARGLSLGVATYIVQSAAAGLEFAHARPGGAIIHADISPSNLLLTTSGEVRVADFGIARREGLGHGVVEGKWAYMAPEQARGEALTPRSDVFALGVVLYELLTGQHPFGRAVTAVERDEQMQVIPPRVIKQAIPPGLDAICMRALAHDPRARYGRMQQLIDALVEERWTNGYREAASDLAQAIREVAPRSEVEAPRTMHTDRPVTIVTRSLLREITPARRPSSPPGAPGALVPAEPPPIEPFSPCQSPSATPSASRPVPVSRGGTRDPFGDWPEGFAAVPTMAVPTMALPAEPPPIEPFSPCQSPSATPSASRPVPVSRGGTRDPFGDWPEGFAAVPTMAVPTTALPAEPPADAFPMVPTSGAQTVARVVDQIALAQAAQAAAAAMLDIPPVLRADGTPMPPFRLPPPGMRGDELASVVGGHTITGHGAAAVAIEPRSFHWALAVLGVAALIGAGAAIAIQMTPSRPDAPPPARTQPSATRSADDTAPGAETEKPSQPERREAPAADLAAQAPAPAIQPTIPDPPARPTLRDAAKPPEAGDTAGTATAGNAPADHGTAGNAPADHGTAGNAPADHGTASSGTASDRTTSDGAAGNGTADHGTAGNGASGNDASAGSVKSSDAGDKTGKAAGKTNGGSNTRKLAAGKDSGQGSGQGKHKAAQGILQVDADPWSWVTVDVETKETPSKFYLPPGNHIVKFYNQDNGLTRYERIVIEPDKVTKLNESMER